MSKYIDLISLLTEEDKKRIENYIYLYGVSETDFIGLDKWLQNWSHSNQLLFKLLGNQFIKKVDYTYEKSREDLERDIRNLLHIHPFKESYHKFYYEIIVPLCNEEKITFEARMGFNHITDMVNFVEDSTYDGIKIKLEGKKCLQIPAGTKPMRALSKIIAYFKDEWDFKEFEDFRLKHSMILNDKTIKAKMCFSIHPLDFMTMSDNDSNWSSCMSWTDGGCYHIGTVEMMNSNNVVCCYLENEKVPFNFAKHGTHVDDPLFTWNNKLWRILAYVNKDIIMSGKAYPYKNKDLSIAVIDNIKRLAEGNLNWTYAFGPELYKDMQYLNSTFAMNRAKEYIRYRPRKHNIIWDTKGMYNDMLNDHCTQYWCYRNKVKYNRVYSVSGKAPCLCCGAEVPYYNDYDGEYDYNERYCDTGNTVCRDCMEEKFTCSCCQNRNPLNKRYTVVIDGIQQVLCEECVEAKIRKCPDCGKMIYIRRPLFHYGNFEQFDTPKEDYNPIYIEHDDRPWKVEHISDEEFLGCYACKDCAQKILPNLKHIEVNSRWTGHKYHLYQNTALTDEDYRRYLWDKLEKIDKDLYPSLEDMDISEGYFLNPEGYVLK